MAARLTRLAAALVLGLMAMLSIPAQAAFDHEQWDTLLAAHVEPVADGLSTRVDYDGMLADSAQLQAYLNRMAAVTAAQFEAWPKAEQLAFLINAYNAWTVELILRHWPGVESIRDLGSWFRTPWQKDFVPLLGAERSLDDIEHGMIRADGVYEEPRIHFAVNCASIGCPPLARQAYVGDRLDAQLEAATKRFLADRDHNALVDGKLYLSSIFKWYGEDFSKGWGGFDSLAEFLIAYRDSLGLTDDAVAALRAGKLRIRYSDYDWGLNGQS
ncbi:MAG: DUF547 domain-containing protein [Sphingomonadales bacterium]